MNSLTEQALLNFFSLIQDRISKAKNPKRLIILFCIAFASCILYFIYNFYGTPEYFSLQNLLKKLFSEFLLIAHKIFVAIIAFISFFTITAYLDNSKDNAPIVSRAVVDKQMKEEKPLKVNLATSDDLNSKNSDLESGKFSFNEQQRNEFIVLLKEKLTATTNAELIDDFKKQATVLFQIDSFRQDISNVYAQSHKRLYDEIETLGRRGNTNLALGIVTTLMGLSFLGFLLSNGEPTKELVPFLVHYLPRLTLVLLIELFAYFFLRLYKSGLEEIKYFQNELTNLESKHIALITAFKQNDTETIKSVINSLANTERNRILNKDQTTIELETIRIEKQSTIDIGKLFTDLVSSIAPKKNN